MKTIKSEYDQQAEQFLTSNGIKFRATLSDTKTPAWSEPRKMDCPTCKGRGETRNPQEKPQTVYEQERGLNKPTYSACKTCHGKMQVEDTKAMRHGHHYRVTLSGIDPRDESLTLNPAKRRLVFDFWGSIADAQKLVTASKELQDMQLQMQNMEPHLRINWREELEKREEAVKVLHPSAYNVLACISGDAYTPETFKDWCSEFGDSPDSIKALQTFRRCSAFAKRLRAFFTAAELEQLQEIQ